MKTITAIIHDTFIYNKRFTQLYNHLSVIIKKFRINEILDIGAGDGKIDSMLIKKHNIKITGVDVLVRDKTYIPVKEYDGYHIKLPNNTVNATMLIDVLHHTDNISATFKEAVRVSNKYIIIKDHLLHGYISYLKLKLMDYVGNYHYGVRLPYNYVNSKTWKKLFKDNNLKIVWLKKNLNLYTGIAHLLFDSNLHFIAVLKKKEDG